MGSLGEASQGFFSSPCSPLPLEHLEEPLPHPLSREPFPRTLGHLPPPHPSLLPEENSSDWGQSPGEVMEPPPPHPCGWTFCLGSRSGQGPGGGPWVCVPACLDWPENGEGAVPIACSYRTGVLGR